MFRDRIKGEVIDVGKFAFEPFSRYAAYDRGDHRGGDHRGDRVACLSGLVTGYRTHDFTPQPSRSSTFG